MLDSVNEVESNYDRIRKVLLEIVNRKSSGSGLQTLSVLQEACHTESVFEHNKSMHEPN